MAHNIWAPFVECSSNVVLDLLPEKGSRILIQAFPAGALDGKVVDARMALAMSFWAKWGSSCDIPFDARKFLREHRQYAYLEGYLKSRPTRPWTVFKSRSR